MANLYPHNQQAYNNAVKAFETTHRTCIIHPTGTGKSLIIANFIENNPGKKHVLLAPSKHIFNEIRKHTELDFKTSTYHGLVFNSAETLDLLNCDFIYLDEFHRIGAVEWGQNLNILLQLNPQAFVLGTTATHIRYLDDHRDMADEIFNNNIASAITLHEAIQSKILQAPKYISALYNVKEIYKTLHDKILNSEHSDKLTIAIDLDKKLIDWENSNGIEQILFKHLTPDRNKILVFCRTKEHIDQMENIIMAGIRKVMPNARSLHIYSNYGTAINEEALRSFSHDDEIPKVLFTVAMVNEGLHVKGNNTVILVRDTSSPIIYYQQIGRAFSVNQTQKPLIFDLINNFDSIARSIHQTDTEYTSVEIIDNNSNRPCLLTEFIEVEFIDQIKDLAKFFDTLYISINSWNIMFQKAKVFYEENGILIPKNDLLLTNWLTTNRSKRKDNILELDKVIKLESIGMDWEPLNNAWNNQFKKAELFYKKNGNLNVPYPSALYSWLRINRSYKLDNTISQEKINKLDSISMCWEPFEDKWNKQYEETVIFYEKNGNLNLKIGSPLISWLHNNRMSKKNNTITQERIDKLDSMGIVWEPRETKWNIRLEEAKLFLKVNGHLNTNNSPLGKWIKKQSIKLKDNTIAKEKRDQLEGIGIV